MKQNINLVIEEKTATVMQPGVAMLMGWGVVGLIIWMWVVIAKHQEEKSQDTLLMMTQNKKHNVQTDPAKSISEEKRQGLKTPFTDGENSSLTQADFYTIANLSKNNQRIIDALKNIPEYHVQGTAVDYVYINQKQGFGLSGRAISPIKVSQIVKVWPKLEGLKWTKKLSLKLEKINPENNAVYFDINTQ